ncbi:hypothetical protein GJAV_G00235820 [Gymnothorax javanicus]|nr:hypothetical protein GJAV_G00235820 [Gymnothorax javanicus]
MLCKTATSVLALLVFVLLSLSFTFYFHLSFLSAVTFLHLPTLSFQYSYFALFLPMSAYVGVFCFLSWCPVYAC